ncbi:hypothetical protein BJ875DRAFT_450914 [Amylocarpus encephaloides]|uniref:G-patch domain-containing protein n=1 Tax=Amylocarpus encephaloides TaxID=45428 RepID=A0A9P7YRL1_9HELO|nr:hypothetical protein BJ875DRAFT_450914 [Amylocarpus encephaloides]
MSDDDEYEIPLQDQRVFGSGIKRRRVKFVPSTSGATSSVTSSTTPANSISDMYLRLVLPEGSEDDASIGNANFMVEHNKGEEISVSTCEICNLPLSSPPSAKSTTLRDGVADTGLSTSVPVSTTNPHEASFAHQVCLQHSHPPSHVDRNRKGLAYLSSYGWNPDSRFGLGASGQGIQNPIKVKPKDDKMGIGVVLPPESERRKTEKPTRLDAGKIKKLDEKDRKRTERLRQTFYQNEDVERYLGGG